MAAISQDKGERWLRVSKDSPCPVCGKADWCTVSPKGSLAHCMRLESVKPANNRMGGWIHRLDEKLDTSAMKPREKPVERDEADWSRIAASACCHAKAGDARKRLASGLGVSEEALERLEVGWGWDGYRSVDFTSWPEKRPGNKCVGIIRRYWQPVGEGRGNKLTMRGSKHGLYLPKDWWIGSGPVLLVEGGSDTAACLTVGLSVIGRPSNVGGINMLIGALRDSGHRPIIVLGEMDRKADRVGTVKQCKSDCDGCSYCWPGRYGCIVTADRLAEALKRNILARLPPEGFKDVREWLQKTSNPTASKLLLKLVKP